MSETIPLARLIRYVRPPPRSVSVARYKGDDRAACLSGMTSADQHAVRTLYEMIGELHAAVRSLTGERELEQVAAVAREFEIDRALALARSLGRDPGTLSETVRRAIHDSRGGAMTSLLVEIGRARGRARPDSGHVMEILARAQLKILRNAFLELDDAHRQADLVELVHPIERLEDALEHVTTDRVSPVPRVILHRDFAGGITSCCTELGALDRAALNLVNNAVGHAASERVDVALVSATRAPGGDLCIFVGNAVTKMDAEALTARFGHDLSAIFVEPFSTTGGGDGLKICADFVASAYGVAQPDEALEYGLVGAALDGPWFVAWMHWPALPIAARAES